MGDPLQLEGTVTAVAFRNDGRTAVASSAGGGQFAAARVWETPQGQGRGKPLLQSAELLLVLFTPDGHNILSSAADGSVRLVNLSGQPIAPVHAHPKYPTTACLSPDGKTYLLGFQDGLLEQWDLLGNRERYAIRTPGWINSVTFSPDGRTYLAGDREGFLWHRETETGRPIGEPFRMSSIWSLTFTLDGQGFLVGTDHGVELWDLGTREMLQKSQSQSQITQISIYPDGKKALLVVDGFARVWNFATDGETNSPRFQPEGGIDRLTLSPDGKRVLISGSDRVARLWDVSTGKQLGPSLGTRVRPVAFTQDNRLMAAGDTDGRIVVWEPSGSIQGEPERIRLWLETLTRMELDSAGTIRGLSAEEVQERARRLQAAGGSPRTKSSE